MIKKIVLIFMSVFTFGILNARLLDSWDPEYDLDSKVWELPYYYLDKSVKSVNFIEISGGCTEVHHLNYLHNVNIDQKLTKNVGFIFQWNINDNLLYNLDYYTYGFYFNLYKNFIFEIRGNPQFEKKDIDLYLSTGYKSYKVGIEPFFAFIKFDNNYSYHYNDLDSMNFYNKRPFMLGMNVKLNLKKIKSLISGYWVRPYTMNVFLNKDSAYSFNVDSSYIKGFVDITPFKSGLIGCKFRIYRFSRVTADTDTLSFKEFYINSYSGYEFKKHFYYVGLKYVNYNMINYTAPYYNRSVFVPYIGIRSDYKHNKFTFEYMKSIGNVNAYGFNYTNPHYENRFLFKWDILIGKNTILTASKGFELDERDIENGSKYFFYDKAYIQLITTF